MLIEKIILGEHKKLVMGQREKNTYSYLKCVKRFLTKIFLLTVEAWKSVNFERSHLTSHMGTWMMKFLSRRKGDEKVMHLIT
jgi:hypothetical protein